MRSNQFFRVRAYHTYTIANITLWRGGIWNLAQTPRKSLKYHESGVMDKMLHNAMWIQIACFSFTDSKLWSFTLRKDHSTKHLFGFEKHIRCRLKFSSLSSHQFNIPNHHIFRHFFVRLRRSIDWTPFCGSLMAISIYFIITIFSSSLLSLDNIQWIWTNPQYKWSSGPWNTIL